MKCENPSHEQIDKWRKTYNEFPQTYSVNWALAGDCLKFDPDNCLVLMIAAVRSSE